MMILNLSFLIFYVALFYIYNIKKKQNNFFIWYLLGQGLFFHFTYVVIEMTDYLHVLESSDEIKLQSFLVILVSNIVIFATYSISVIKVDFSKVKINKKLIKMLYIILGAIYVYCFLYALSIFSKIGLNNINNNMILRNELQDLGPFVIILMVPLGFSTFYWINFINNPKFKNFLLSILITVPTIFIALIRGQRTDLALIIVFPLIYYFYKKRNLIILVLASILLLIISSIYLKYFKVTTMYLNLSIKESLLNTVSNDIDRNWSLWKSVEKSHLIFNEILPVSYQGYFYTLLTFVPRRIADFKGYSTETWFLYSLGKSEFSSWATFDISQINWGITMSGVTEALINGGFVGVILYSILLGVFMKGMHKISQLYNSLYSVTFLVSFLFAAYSLYNIIIIYLPIVITLLILSLNTRVKKEEKITIT